MAEAGFSHFTAKLQKIGITKTFDRYCIILLTTQFMDLIIELQQLSRIGQQNVKCAKNVSLNNNLCIVTSSVDKLELQTETL